MSDEPAEHAANCIESGEDVPAAERCSCALKERREIAVLREMLAAVGEIVSACDRRYYLGEGSDPGEHWLAALDEIRELLKAAGESERL